MKIFDGLEEIEILPWYQCADCSKHLHFRGLLSARLFLHSFRISKVVMDSLRRLIGERRDDLGLQIPDDYQLVDQVAHLLAIGELHATRKPLAFGTGVTSPNKQAAPPQIAPEPPGRPAAEPPPPPPEEPVFLPNGDPVAIAQVLGQAAQSGVPFCEE